MAVLILFLKSLFRNQFILQDHGYLANALCSESVIPQLSLLLIASNYRGIARLSLLGGMLHC